MIKKTLFSFAFLFTFFFLFIPNTFAKTTADYMKDKDKYSQSYNPIIYSNLDLTDNFFKYNNPVFYFGQRTNDLELNFPDWKVHYSSGGVLTYKPGATQTFRANNDNIESFVYGMELSPNKVKFEANKKYELFIIVSTTDEVDSYEEVTFDDTIQFLNGSNIPYETSFNRFYFLKETGVEETGFIHYWFCFQFEFANDVTGPKIVLGDQFDAFSENSIHYLSNRTNKNILFSYAQIRFFNVDEFSKSSGIIHGGGGMTFDGERTDDSSFDDVTGVCDTLDITCHFNNLKGWLTLIGRRISNAFEEFFTSIVDKISGILKTAFVPDFEELKSTFFNFQSFLEKKLGFIYFPIDFTIDFLDRFISMSNTSSKIITVPDVTLGPFGTIIHGFQFNIAQYWESGPFAQIYTLYLIFVHAFIGFCLYKLCLKKYNEIVGGVYF